MRFVSTRGGSPALSFSEAIATSLAPDGGLYVPEKFPVFRTGEFDGALELPEVAERLLAPFLAGDRLAPELGAIVREALSFELPLRRVKAVAGRGETWLLELFHGPTAAFKDVGARFLAACLARADGGASKPRTVLVATSGDTGGAVAGAFFGRPGFDVVILFPKGKVSRRQEKQLTGWGGNVRAFAVEGTFDDCQRMAKEAFADRWWRANHNLVSANSINIGRLLPQSTYYAAAALQFARETGRPPAGFVVPTGNLGNAVAALWARQMGFATGRVVFATNANRAIPEFLASGMWKPLPTVATPANAMDVGNPSNVERLRALYPTIDGLRRDTQAASVDDTAIRETVRDEIRRSGEVLCPHTAVAMRVRESLAGDGWIVVATAHPAKFETIVEPLIGRTVEVPEALSALLSRASTVTELEPRLEALREALA